MIGNNDIVREVSWKALKEVWTLIDIEMMKKLIGGMERRIKVVVAAEGWYTKY